MLRLILLSIALSLSWSSPVLKPHPIEVIIATDDQQNIHLGGHDRANFALVEQFQPLARAYSHSSHKKIQYVYKPYIPPKPAAVTPAKQVLKTPIVESTTAAPATSPMTVDPVLKDESDKKERVSEWLAWTSWTPCRNSERKRVRGCLQRANGNCEGSSVEKQSCYAPQWAPIKFAKNPWTIEREISRSDDK
ncbi:hypothetical protein L596_011879 [Steinernema carpocapsae]|uniref:Uncharacterized protein n=1 Tax=Steinernema carpocapsae TaxID=34508 RepID=A0A4U5NVB9_STECR|nr:hypothetical protein L596_011879 [Steinernema carpocapsae]